MPFAVAEIAVIGNPTEATFSWRNIFFRRAEVSLEIGPGRGDFLLSIATQHPEGDFFAIERSPARAHALAQRISERRQHNSRVLCADAACVIAQLPAAVVDRYFVQFPDPWWKRRHRRRRVWTPAFVASIARTLRPGGSLHFLTDVDEYYAAARQQIDAHPDLDCIDAGPRTNVSTEFALKARRHGSAIYGAIWVRLW